VRWAWKDYEDGQLEAARVLCGLNFRTISGSSSFRVWVVVNYAVLGKIIWIVPSSVKDTDCDTAIIAGNLACAVLIHPNPLCAPVDASLAKVFWSRFCDEVPCFKINPKVLPPLALHFNCYVWHLDFPLISQGTRRPAPSSSHFELVISFRDAPLLLR
jgi:hypothetical protein